MVRTALYAIVGRAELPIGSPQYSLLCCAVLLLSTNVANQRSGLTRAEPVGRARPHTKQSSGLSGNAVPAVCCMPARPDALQHAHRGLRHRCLSQESRAMLDARDADDTVVIHVCDEARKVRALRDVLRSIALCDVRCTLRSACFISEVVDCTERHQKRSAPFFVCAASRRVASRCLLLHVVCAGSSTRTSSAKRASCLPK